MVRIVKKAVDGRSSTVLAPRGQKGEEEEACVLTGREEVWNGLSPSPGDKPSDGDPTRSQKGNFSFFSITGWGIDLDYSDIEWFALETNRSFCRFWDCIQVLHFRKLHSYLCKKPWYSISMSDTPNNWEQEQAKNSGVVFLSKDI